MDERGGPPPVRLGVLAGEGRLARRGNCLLFVPPSEVVTQPEVDDLMQRFDRSGATDETRSTNLPRCFIEWGEIDDPIEVDTTIDLQGVVIAGDGVTAWSQYPLTGPRHTVDPEVTAELSITSHGGWQVGLPGDLRSGEVPAGGFELHVPRMSHEHRLARRSEPADVTAEPEQFEELTDLDVTLAPVGPTTYPDDDTDRTFRRSGDVRCPRGHANPNTHNVCRVCGDSLDATAGRSGPRPSTAIAGLRLPDGSVIPINRSIAVGRSPSAEGARLENTPRLVAIEAPGTVSRTHVLLRLDAGIVTATDCGARGRTAVTPAGGGAPVALEPWQPRRVEIGDTIQLGGPTTLTITDPTELRVPAGLEPTAPPPERNETR